MMNYFGSRSAAERYARGRLFFHPLVVQRISEFLSLKKPFPAALDVGCGIGLSTTALKEIARRVTGLDLSTEMLALSPRRNGLTFVAAHAEELPFRKAEFNLVTLSQVIHWLDRDRFLVEAGRVLRPGGWLIVYDDYFSVDEGSNHEFQKWYRADFLKRYPTPPRAEVTFTAENTERYGFRLRGHEWHRHGIGLSLAALIDYLVTQSNVIAVVESGEEMIEETRMWLAEGLKLMFGDAEEKEFLFNAPIWFLQRDSP